MLVVSGTHTFQQFDCRFYPGGMEAVGPCSEGQVRGRDARKVQKPGLTG